MIFVSRRFRKTTSWIAGILWLASLAAAGEVIHARLWDGTQTGFALFFVLITLAQTATLIATVGHCQIAQQDLLKLVYDLGACDGSGGQVRPLKWAQYTKDDVIIGVPRVG